jgi:hypothetical protein
MNDIFLPDERRIAEEAMEFAIGHAKERRLPPSDLPLAKMQWAQFAVEPALCMADGAHG